MRDPIFDGDILPSNDDVVNLPVRIGPSDIEGEGVIAVRNIPVGYPITRVTDVFQANDDPFIYLTRVGHKLNHSYTPNAQLIKRGIGSTHYVYYLNALKQIKTGEEVTVNYNTLQPDFGRAPAHFK